MAILNRRNILIGSVVVLAGVAFEGRKRRHAPNLMTDGRRRSLRLIWPDCDTDPLALLATQGSFDKYNLDVTLVNAAHGDAAIDALLGGRADAAVSPLLDWLPRFHTVAPDQPMPGQLICGIEGSSYRVIVNRNLDIHHVADLATRNIGVTRLDGADRRYLGIRLRRAALNPDQGVNWVAIPEHELDDALRTGRVDAIVAHDPLGWQILHQTKGLGVSLLDSMSGAERRRIDQVVGLPGLSMTRDPGLAPALILALRDAAQHWDALKTAVAAALEQVPDGPDDPRGMLARETPPHIVADHQLVVQVAQYADELKLIGLVPEVEMSTKLARRLCAPRVEAPSNNPDDRQTG
ncbi:ABC transporter substrate-binding protein [Brytella acorum]|uniref:ABC transporter substrate-binding protein n=1 Tax=Brytella acorum TaxID=2959299 RepID=A0AA35Y5K8_9PROT|nr:ABC transporter substrate-binding protein [Brytella acorum]MDF3626053.1 ABC transporter substrate-binding protein [Brytella acorum]CAI9122154.1 ABC transporter substrate-binding protein [Brytella acorum]